MRSAVIPTSTTCFAPKSRPDHRKTCITMIRAVLFDLDGTLADTAPDLGLALNLLRAESGLPPVPLAQTRPLTSSGARGLIKAGFGYGTDHPDYNALKDRFLDHYGNNICRGTRLFDGMERLLDVLESRKITWGIVTNKAARFTDPLIAALGLSSRAACVVSGDTTPRAKPAPDPLLHAARIIGIPPSECIYVGDDLRDILAARSAGMASLAAAYGYLGEDGSPASWGADGVVNLPTDVLQYL